MTNRLISSARALLILLSCTSAQAGDPILGIAERVAIFEACSNVSPTLAERYSRWLARFDPDMRELVAQARMVNGFEELTKHIEAEFAKHSSDELLRVCNSEFDRGERWGQKNTDNVPPNQSLQRTAFGAR